MSERQELYDCSPSITVEPSRKICERHGKDIYEVEKAAFVKISTAFKGELADVPGKSLKIWVYIALSINRNTNQAFPGLRNIAENTGMAINTVRKYLEPLEDMGLLTIHKQDGKGNIYEVPFFVSANKKAVSSPDTGTVSKMDDTVSKKEATVSKKNTTVSNRVIHNQNNQSNQNNHCEFSENQATDILGDSVTSRNEKIKEEGGARLSEEELLLAASGAGVQDPLITDWLPPDLTDGNGYKMWREWCGIALRMRPNSNLLKGDVRWVDEIRNLIEEGFTWQHIREVAKNLEVDDYQYISRPSSIKTRLQKVSADKPTPRKKAAKVYGSPPEGWYE